MADLTVTAANLRMLDAVECRLMPVVADATITRGQVVYRKTNGRVALARGNAAGTGDPLGIATSNAVQGGVLDVLYFGRLVGYDLSGMDPGERVYVSAATAGALADVAPSTAGQFVAGVGSVQVMTDLSATKFLMVDISPAAVAVEVPA